VVDDDDPLRQLVGLVEVMGGEQDRGAVLGSQSADVGPQVRPVLGIEPGRWFVKKQHVGSVDEAHRDVQSPALAPGQRRHDPVDDPLQIERSDQFGRPRTCRRNAHAVCPALTDQLVTASLTVPGAVRTQQGDQLTGLDLQIQAAHRFNRLPFDLEVPGQAIRADHRRVHANRLVSPRVRSVVVFIGATVESFPAAS
jgi:hypothetical protein